MSSILDQDIMYLPGVGPKKKEILSKELGINSYGDLLEYYPYKYVDRSKVYHISELTSEMPYVQIKGRILSYEEIDTGKRNKMLVAHFSDGFGVVDLTWFRGAQYIMKTYKVGTEYLVFGKPTVFNGRFQFTHPDMDDATHLQISEMGMQPYYSLTENLRKRGYSSRSIEKMSKQLVTILPPLPETLPSHIVERLHLVSRDAAIRMIHYPHSHQEMQKAQVRLKFEELFYVQLNILRYASDQRRKYRGYVFNRIADIFNGFYADHLPFELTGAQKRVMHEIRADMCSGRQMNRLLQGDVGSGKTLVALMTMLIALDNGYQACMMAPTEILAEQHLQTIHSFLKGMDIRVELLTGIVKEERKDSCRPRHRRYPDSGRHPCRTGRPRGVPAPGHCRHRRAAPLWCGTESETVEQERESTAYPRDDCHPYPAHPRHDHLWRPGRERHRRTATGQKTDTDPA